MRKDRLAAMAAAAVVVCACAAGLYLIGSPAEQRLLRLDERRTEDLFAIARAVNRHWERTGALPSTLDDVVAGGRALSKAPLDPVTGEPYEYRLVDSANSIYLLCASFARESQPTSNPEFWRHGSGHACFSFAPGGERGVPYPPRAG